MELIALDKEIEERLFSSRDVKNKEMKIQPNVVSFNKFP